MIHRSAVACLSNAHPRFSELLPVENQVAPWPEDWVGLYAESLRFVTVTS
jgi:hypothetical protein